ncbi:MAG: hypothetical protein AMXMBFR58_24670 [Phycisphaerae bacterium]
MHTTPIRFLSLATVFACAPASAEVVRFEFAPVGQSRSYFLGSDDPLVGKRVVSTTIHLYVLSRPGSDAANFFTDHSFPIEPDPGSENALVFYGSDENWKGDGNFAWHLEDSPLFNGVFVPARYGSETPGFDFDGEILEGSYIEMVVVPAPSVASIGLAATGLLAGRRRRA